MKTLTKTFEEILTKYFPDEMDLDMLHPNEPEALKALIQAVKARDEVVAGLFSNHGQKVYKALIEYRQEETL